MGNNNIKSEISLRFYLPGIKKSNNSVGIISVRHVNSFYFSEIVNYKISQKDHNH